MKFDPKDLNLPDASHLLTDIVSPRPIAWVSTVGENGVFNLAPFSAYGMVCVKPMVVAFSVSSNRDGRKKDTLRNIESSKEFVVCVVTEELAEKMNLTSASYPPDVSEFEKVGLTPAKADLVKPPLVAESPVNMECRVTQIMEFGSEKVISKLIIGEVLRVHVADRLYDKQNKRLSGLNPVGRLGGDGGLYCRTRDMFEMKRPTL